MSAADDPATALMPVNMLWIGGPLGRIERLSLVSFLANGHPVRLFTYEAVGAVPAGVELRDGNEIVPFATMAANRYRNGSWALAANLFRLLLQRAGKGLWADMDVVCIRPVAIDAPVIVGWETRDYLNNAVMRLPAESPLLAEAIDAFRPNYIPDWLPLRKTVRARLRLLLGKTIGPADLPRGALGPKMLTALARRHALLPWAQPPDVFYPLAPRHAMLAFEPGLTLDEVVTERTLTLHLWNEKLGSLRHGKPAPGSLVAALFDRYGL
jgi:hypothetical protein